MRAITFGFLTDEEAKTAAADLNELIIKNDYHLNTGFLSTPLLPWCWPGTAISTPLTGCCSRIPAPAALRGKEGGHHDLGDLGRCP